VIFQDSCIFPAYSNHIKGRQIAIKELFINGYPPATENKADVFLSGVTPL
jgi:hypothetical protein